MDLIIKPTELCNFKCTFCSSSDISTVKTAELDLSKIYQFLRRFPETQTIIVNGGDPLMMPPEYYRSILSHLDQHNYKATLSFTSNLWAFYQSPEKWLDIFRHPRSGVATSFNYGDTRRVSTTKIFTESLFWEVSDTFLKWIGYRPDFISVITEENEHKAIDNVYLAKKMNVECKLNYAMASGEQSRPYILSKIYRTYIEIYRLGLTHWEFNTKQMVQRVTHGATVCPQNRNCDTSIRCLQPEGDYYSCGAFGDDREMQIDFEKEMSSTDFLARPLSTPDLLSMKAECFGCKMFEICNGCKKTIKDLKRANLVEEHCKIMKQNEPHISAIRDQQIPREILNHPTHGANRSESGSW